MRVSFLRAALVAFTVVAAGCGGGDQSANSPALKKVKPVVDEGNVTADRLTRAEKDPDNWLTHGRTYDEQRYSPLTQQKIL